MTRAILLVAFSAFVAACASTGDDLNQAPSAAAGGTAASADAQLFRDIAQANLAEIAAGKLAVATAQSPAVRGFAQRMIDDHSLMLSEGTRVARAKGIPVPTEPAPHHQAAAKELQQMSGERLEIAYMKHMVQDHVDTLQLLEQAYAQMQDQDLRAHAQKGIPQVRQHLDAARRIAGDLVG